eukprot:5476758-Amphidinium_carterae.1
MKVLDLEFSVTIADPTREDCPLVACSKGFTDLTGPGNIIVQRLDKVVWGNRKSRCGDFGLGAYFQRIVWDGMHIHMSYDEGCQSTQECRTLKYRSCLVLLRDLHTSTEDKLQNMSDSTRNMCLKEHPQIAVQSVFAK